MQKRWQKSSRTEFGISRVVGPHDFSNMALGIKASQALFQGQHVMAQGNDRNPLAFYKTGFFIFLITTLWLVFKLLSQK